ncbi:unnamed protein product, partial [Owenia fusiformis]
GVSSIPDLKGCDIDGTIYNIGDEIKQDDPCTNCRCELQYGTQRGFKMCSIIDCAPTFCENPLYIEGVCCPTCEPLGKGCDIDGKLYNIGDVIEQDDPCMECKCEQLEYGTTKGTKMCLTMSCQAPPCDNPEYIEGVCCPVCDPGEKGVCKYDDKYFQNGSSFPANDGCNRCTCTDRQVLCTEIHCEKPGMCPRIDSDSAGICTHECDKDDRCQGKKKCCSNGCGKICVNPI